VPADFNAIVVCGEQAPLSGPARGLNLEIVFVVASLSIFLPSLPLRHSTSYVPSYKEVVCIANMYPL